MAWRRFFGLWWLGSLGLALGLARCGGRTTMKSAVDDPDAQQDAGLDTGVDAPVEAGPPDVWQDVAPDVPSIEPGLGEGCDGRGGRPAGCAPGLSCWTGDPQYEDGERWPGGYCTLECYSDGLCASWGGVCSGLERGAGHCMLECDEPADCRQGYACIPATAQATTACLPTGFIATRGPGEACFQHDDPGAAHYLPPPMLGFGENQRVYTADLSDEVVLAVDDAQNVVVGANSFSNQSYQNPAYYGNGAPPNISFRKSTGPIDALSAYYSDPNLVVGADGTFYYSTLGIDFGTARVRLLVGRSDNQGASFSTVHANPAADCNPDPAGGLEGVCLDHPWLAIGPDKLDPTNEALYAAYLATRPNDYACVLLRSTDGGTSWGIPDSPDTSLSVFSYAELGLFVNLITPAVDEAGDVHMVAVGVLGELRGSSVNAIYYSRSEDGGKSRTPPVVVNAPGEAIPFDQPVIAVDGSTIWVAYTRGAGDGAWDIVLAKSTDGGQRFSYEVVNDEPEPCATHFHPAIVVDPASHRVFVGWYDGRYAPYEGYVAYSVCDPSMPAGSICSENRAINDVPFYVTTDRNTLAFIGDYFGLVAGSGGELWAAWGDTRFDFVSRAYVAKASTP